MENKQQTSEQQLQSLADKAGVTLRELKQLFNKAYIDDEQIRSRLIKQQEMEMQYMQQQLMTLQYRNETMNNKLLTYDLERKVKRMELKKKFMGWFKHKEAKHA